MKASKVSEPFSLDNEYGLADLLQSSALEEISRNLTGTGYVSFLILNPNGEIYHRGNSCTSVAERLSSHLKHNKYDKQEGIDFNDGEYAVIFPIEHELEKIGYLALSAKDRGAESRPDLVMLGEFFTGAIKQIIHYHYRYLLTAGLHGSIVRESYDELIKKT
jgi:hypothetical protein